MVCGNAIVEIGEKNFVAIVAMSLLKMGGKKKEWLEHSVTQPRLELKARVSECTFSSLQMDFKFFFSNQIIIPKMVGEHSCSFKDIRFPIAKELMRNDMSTIFS